MESWITHSNVTQQRIGAVLILVAGLFLCWGFRDASGPGLTESRAGLALGWLLVGVSVWTLVADPKTTITINPRTRRIQVLSTHAFGRSEKSVRFDEITEVWLGETGDDEGGNTRYHVVAKLRSGKELPLFYGFFEGSLSRPTMQSRCDRLQTLLERPTPTRR